MNIEKKQCLLKYLDYYEGKVDGIDGKLTQAAQQAFREANGMPALGDELDEVLIGAVFHSKFKGVVSKTETTTNGGDWWGDIKHFRREEFGCKCGGMYCNGYPVEPDELLLTVADRVRDHFDAPMYVSSGIRCQQWNIIQGGASGSRHKKGKAMDFYVAGKTANEVLAYVKKQPEIRYCYAINDTYVHMDVE